MRVIEKVAAEMKGITIVGPGSIRAGRDGDALVRWNGRPGELANQPAIGDVIVKDDGIAVAIALADATKAGPDRGDGRWPQNRCTRRLIKDLIAFVHHLNVLG